jgi:hypothetical protein
MSEIETSDLRPAGDARAGHVSPMEPYPEGPPVNIALYARRLAEERACGRYLAAYKQMADLGRRVASWDRLCALWPSRRDYQAARDTAAAQHATAAERAALAFAVWQDASWTADATWTVTEGRRCASAAATIGRVA